MPKLPMSGKQEGREPARRYKSTSGEEQTRYRCLACDRPRSSTYHSRYPPSKPPPPPGICRRCTKMGKQREHHPPPPAITIYEIHHHHHHACTCSREQPPVRKPLELPLRPAYPRCVELPAEDKKGRFLSQHQLFEPMPPPMKLWTKPSF
jgi:hypothetical protein